MLDDSAKTDENTQPEEVNEKITAPEGFKEATVLTLLDGEVANAVMRAHKKVLASYMNPDLPKEARRTATITITYVNADPDRVKDIACAVKSEAKVPAPKPKGGMILFNGQTGEGWVPNRSGMLNFGSNVQPIQGE